MYLIWYGYLAIALTVFAIFVLTHGKGEYPTTAHRYLASLVFGLIWPLLVTLGICDAISYGYKRLTNRGGK